MKNIQVFVHRHYETIKLTLLLILLGLSMAIILDSIHRNRREIAARNDVINAIKGDNEAQTDIMNRQFRATCFLIIETSGAEALKKLDAETQARCDNLAEEPTESAAQQQPQGQSSPQPRSLSNSSLDSSSNNTTPSPSTQPDNSQEPQSPSPPSPPKESILPLVDEPVVGCTVIGIREVCL